MRSCNSDISAFGVVVRMVKLRVTRLVGPRKLSQAGECYRLSVLTRRKARLDHLPLVERVRRHEAASPGQGILEHADVAAVSERALIGLRLGRFLRPVRQQAPLQQIEVAIAGVGMAAEPLTPA